MNVPCALEKNSIVGNSAAHTDRCIPKTYFMNSVLYGFTVFCPLELFSLRGMFKVFCYQCISCFLTFPEVVSVSCDAYIFTTTVALLQTVTSQL